MKMARVAAGCIAMLLSGCVGSDLPSEPGVIEVSDSAGIRIVTLRGDLRSFAHPKADLIDEVRLTQESTGVNFFRVSDAALLPSGTLVVANAGIPEVVVLGGEAVEARFGGLGEGPGDFRTITSVHTLEDSTVLAYDDFLGRMTSFSLAGELQATRGLSDPLRGLNPLVASADGTVLAVITDIRDFSEEGIRRDTTPLLRFTRAQDQPDTISQWGVNVWSVRSAGAGPTRAQVPFSPTFLSSGGAARFALADSHESEVSIFDEYGELVSLVRWEQAPTPVSDDDVERWNEERWGDLPQNMPADARRNLTNVPPHESHPLSEDLHVGGEGWVWIAPTILSTDERLTWLILDDEGQAKGSVELPRSSTILDSRGDRVALLEFDELDVESIGVYRLANLQN